MTDFKNNRIKKVKTSQKSREKNKQTNKTIETGPQEIWILE